MAATDDFFDALTALTTRIGPETFAFTGPDDRPCAFVQIVCTKPGQIDLHRLWAVPPGRGHGSRMLRTLCSIADRCGVEIALKVLPFGPKPYPMSRELLGDWYRRHGFDGKKTMARKPRPPQAPIGQ